MSKIELPYAEPMYATYHWMSGAGIPAKQNPTSDIWYYNNTVDWRCGTKFLNGTTTKLDVNLTCGNAWSIPFLKLETIPTDFIKCDPLGVIKCILNNKFYINYSGIDDYYVQGKSGYHEWHNFHDGLIMGYNDDENTFTIAAYDQSHKFRSFKTPQNTLLDGINSMYDNEIYGCLFPVKATNEQQIIDIPYIISSIQQYLNPNIALSKTETCETIGGIAVYDYYCKYLDLILDGCINNIYECNRVIRFAWEHKKCMLGRFMAIENELSLDNTTSHNYQQVVEIADRSRFMHIKHMVKPSHVALPQIKDNFIKMKDLECSILQDLLDKTRNSINVI